MTRISPVPVKRPEGDAGGKMPIKNLMTRTLRSQTLRMPMRLLRYDAPTRQISGKDSHIHAATQYAVLHGMCEPLRGIRKSSSDN